MDSLLLGRRILLVEDEVMVSWALEQAIASLECVVVGPAARIGQALAMIETEVFDAALLDINLNGEKSYPVADALIARGLPFVFSTGYNRDSAPAGYEGYPRLQKPFSIPELGDVLTRLLTAKPQTSR